MADVEEKRRWQGRLLGSLRGMNRKHRPFACGYYSSRRAAWGESNNSVVSLNASDNVGDLSARRYVAGDDFIASVKIGLGIFKGERN